MNLENIGEYGRTYTLSTPMPFKNEIVNRSFANIRA